MERLVVFGRRVGEVGGSSLMVSRSCTTSDAVPSRVSRAVKSEQTLVSGPLPYLSEPLVECWT